MQYSAIIIMMWNISWLLHTKLDLHVISVCEWYAYYAEWNKKYESSQEILC
jgi:hypothetical protein